MALVRLLFKHIAPAALIGGLHGLQQTRFPLLPVSPSIHTHWWGLALLMGVTGALVASNHFRDEREFGTFQFIGLLFASLALALPIMVAPYDYSFGLSPVLFSVLSTAAYVLFHGILGVLVGGAWTVLVVGFLRPSAEPASREWPE